MYLAILAWKLRTLPDPRRTLTELREWVERKAADDYTRVEGVRLKTWISDEHRLIWGAVYIVDSPEAIDVSRLPKLPDGRTGPLGTRPDVVDWFAVETSVFGPSDPWELHRWSRDRQ